MQVSARIPFSSSGSHTPRRHQRSAAAGRLCRANAAMNNTTPCEKPSEGLKRREAMLSAASILVGAQVLAMPSPALADPFGFDKKAQKEEFTKLAEGVVSEMISKEDAPAATRLALRCVSTYDAANKVGGFNGSIFTRSDELSRPENAPIRPFAEKLQKVKEAVDKKAAASGFGPISYSDSMVLAVRRANMDKWAAIKIAAGNRDSIEAFGAPWPYVLGRVDSTDAGPFHLPADDAQVEDIRAALLKVGVDPNSSGGPFSAKPIFWEKPGFLIWCAGAADEGKEEERFAAASEVYRKVKKDYDGSRSTVTRTNYEVDFINLFTRLSYLGAKFNSDQYTKA